SRPLQGRQRPHRRCHHKTLHQRQSDRADLRSRHLSHPLQELQIQEGLQAAIVSTSRIPLANRSQQMTLIPSRVSNAFCV
ncbi:MAG: hypothetical protein ACREMY_31220, partial [bacterium]